MTQLIFTSTQFVGQSFQVPEGRTTVGRARDNALIIEDDTVSAHHCEILRYGREIIVRDRASTNGTWIGGSRVKGQTGARHGQCLRFGAVEARLELPPPALEDHHTEVTAVHLLARSDKQSGLAPEPQTSVIVRPHPCPASAGFDLQS